MLFLVTLSIFFNYYLNKSLLFNKTMDNSSKYNHHFKTYINTETDMMKSFIYFIKKTKNVEENFINQKKDELYNITKPILQTLYDKNNITHFYFIKNNGEVFLRVHSFQKDKDVIDRYTFLRAKEEKEIFVGTEFGLKNNFTLRVVYPWEVDGKIIGYIELGKEIDKISDEITKELDVDIFYLIKKGIFNNNELLDLKEITLDKEKYLLAYHTANNNYHLDNSSYVLNQRDEWIFTEKQVLIKSVEKLYDVSNKDLGYKIFLIDVTMEYLELKKTMIFYASIISITTLFMIILGFVFSKRKQRELDLLLRRLEKEKLKATDLYVQQRSFLALFDKGESVLFRWKNDENWSVDYVSKNVKKIFGYTRKEFLDKDIVYENCIHEDDINRVANEVKEIKNSKKIYFKHEPYRIKTKSGKIKWVRDYTIANTNKENEIIHFLGYIVDITKEYKFQQNLEKFIETQDNIVLLTNGYKLNFGNKKLFEFFGFENLEEFLKKHTCICELFIENDKFFHLGKIENKNSWIDFIEKLDEPDRIVQMANKYGTKYIFTISITNFDTNLKILSFTDITKTIQTQLILEEQSIKDNLTNAFNRNYFDLKYQNIIDDFTKNGYKLGIAILDIDFFKKVNDSFGHDMGDYVLKEFVKIIQNSIRNEDILIRWGGEEFLLLLKINDNQSFEKVLNNIRIEIQNNIFDTVGNITCSIGGTIYINNHAIEESIKNADICLYKAKTNGRNQVIVL